MKTFNFLIVILVLVSFSSGCTKEEILVSELEETTQKAARVKPTPDLLTITRTLPNGKVITITVPANTVEKIIEESPKLPYSPEGVYLFRHKERELYYDVYITYFDGGLMKGTYGYPAGGNYIYTGEIEGLGSAKAIYTGYLIFFGEFFIGTETKHFFVLGTSSSDGIIKDWEIRGKNEFLVQRTIPYSPEGQYLICEYNNDRDPERYIEFWVTSFEKNNFKGKYISRINIGDLGCEYTGELEGNIVMKGETPRFTMNLYPIEGGDVPWKTIEGFVDISEGMNAFNAPFGIPIIEVVE